ncbi:MAG: hypothetical protein ACRDNL_26560, partial [Spirillospora sp.]
MPAPEEPAVPGNPPGVAVPGRGAAPGRGAERAADSEEKNSMTTGRRPSGSAVAQGAHMTHPGPGVMPGLEPPTASGPEGPGGRDEAVPPSGMVARDTAARDTAAAGTQPGGEDVPKDVQGETVQEGTVPDETLQQEQGTGEIVPRPPVAAAASAGSAVLGGA